MNETKAEKYYSWYAVRILIVVVVVAIGITCFDYLRQGIFDDLYYNLHAFKAEFATGTILTLSLGAIVGLVVSKVKKESFEKWFWRCAWYVSLVYIVVHAVAMIAILVFLATFKYCI